MFEGLRHVATTARSSPDRQPAWARRAADATALRGRRALRVALATGAVLALAAAGATTAGAVTCEQPVAFDPANFTRPTTIDNQYLPLVPGTQTVLGGTAANASGQVLRTVTFTVTDVTKIVAGVSAVVVWDVDQNDGQLAESELSFWAQDDAGNVWNVGEYPEEYVNGLLVGADSTWIAGIVGAEPGVHMFAPPPAPFGPYYVQGRDLSIEFFDCARVDAVDRRAVTRFGTFEHTLRTKEISPLDPGPAQRKYHAPGVGIVRIEPVNDPEAETLDLVDRRQLDADELASVRRQVLEQDERGYNISPVYAETQVKSPPPPASPPTSPPPPTPVAQPAATVPALTTASARAHVRRALGRHLRRWRITRLTCRVRTDGRAACAFTASRRGKRLSGQGVVSRDASGALHHRLTVHVTKIGCRPATSRRCRSTRRWSS